jgi:hypothetical protein
MITIIVTTTIIVTVIPLRGQGGLLEPLQGPPT